MKDIKEYKLAGNTTVGQLLSWMEDKTERSKTKIITLIRHRFENRYLIHIKSVDSGFLIMAVSCFVIETLQSFREGKPDTRRIGRKLFGNFFKNNSEYFPGFVDISDQFYNNIRCGILHQSETKNAWRILRNGQLLDTKEFSINAELFLISLEKSVEKYLKQLAHSDFNSDIWEKAFKKLTNICENCKR